jgi:hypothetical protein
MGISVFPAAAAASVLETKAVTVPASTTGYRLSTSFPASTYTITCPSTVATTVTFEDSAGAIGRVVTSSGSVQVSLSRDADKALIYTNAGTNVIVTITPSGRSLTPVTTGVPDTYSSTASVTNLSAAYAVVVGGGGGGGGAGGYPGGGGGAGGISAGYVTLNGDASAVIGGSGAGGPPTGGYGSPGGNSGGTTNLSGTGFTTLTANGGGGGGYSLYQGSVGGGGGSGSGGTSNVNGGAGGNGSYGGGGTVSYNSGEFIWVKSGDIGSGGAGNGSNGTGFGGGGGAAGGNPTGTGGSGTSGVVYILEV